MGKQHFGSFEARLAGHMEKVATKKEGWGDAKDSALKRFTRRVVAPGVSKSRHDAKRFKQKWKPRAREAAERVGYVVYPPTEAEKALDNAITKATGRSWFREVLDRAERRRKIRTTAKKFKGVLPDSVKRYLKL